MSLKLTLLSLAAMIALVPGQAAAVSAGPALAANAGHPAVGRALGIIRNNGGSSWTRSFVLLIEDPKAFVARSDFVAGISGGIARVAGLASCRSPFPVGRRRKAWRFALGGRFRAFTRR